MLIKQKNDHPDFFQENIRMYACNVLVNHLKITKYRPLFERISVIQNAAMSNNYEKKHSGKGCILWYRYICAHREISNKERILERKEQLI